MEMTILNQRQSTLSEMRGEMSLRQAIKAWLFRQSCEQRLKEQREKLDNEWARIKKEALEGQEKLHLAEHDAQEKYWRAELGKVKPIPPPKPEVLKTITRAEAERVVKQVIPDVSPKLRDLYYDLITRVSFQAFLEWARVWEFNVIGGVRRLGKELDCDDAVRILLGKLSEHRAWSKIPCGLIVYEQHAKPESHMAVIALLADAQGSYAVYHVEPQDVPDKAIELFPVPNIKKVLEVGWM